MQLEQVLFNEAYDAFAGNMEEIPYKMSELPAVEVETLLRSCKMVERMFMGTAKLVPRYNMDTKYTIEELTML